MQQAHRRHPDCPRGSPCGIVTSFLREEAVWTCTDRKPGVNRGRHGADEWASHPDIPPPDSSPATRRSAYHWGPSRGIQTMARLPVPPECLLGSDPRAGLDSTQVAERRRQFGDNDVTEDRHRPLWAVVTASATDPMLWFLLLMGVLFFALGDTTEAIVLLLAIIP